MPMLMTLSNKWERLSPKKSKQEHFVLIAAIKEMYIGM